MSESLSLRFYKLEEFVECVEELLRVIDRMIDVVSPLPVPISNVMEDIRHHIYRWEKELDEQKRELAQLSRKTETEKTTTQQ
jgi:hypothetical protein